MPRMSDVTVVAANASSANVLAGLLEEFVTVPSACHAMATTTAAGLRTTFIVGRRAVISDQAISSANRYPIVGQDDMFTIGVRGGRLFWTFRNTTAAPLTVTWAVDVDPV